VIRPWKTWNPVTQDQYYYYRKLVCYVKNPCTESNIDDSNICLHWLGSICTQKAWWSNLGIPWKASFKLLSNGSLWVICLGKNISFDVESAVEHFFFNYIHILSQDLGQSPVSGWHKDIMVCMVTSVNVCNW